MATTTRGAGSSRRGAVVVTTGSPARSEWQKPVTKDRNEVLSWLGIGKRGALELADSITASSHEPDTTDRARSARCGRGRSPLERDLGSEPRAAARRALDPQVASERGDAISNPA
jgi:hypothetical protein